ncbi:unnamed protein product [Amoebophrya sp. A25]|nr:unnamed protein product [Amoebophrya sp. A25]|eukprot:GSA25T00004782001.1
MIRPASNCCGVFTLLFGVEVICLLNLISAIFVVSLVSSTEILTISGIKIPPATQVLYGAWCLIGIPLIISAGVGAVYRVESQLRAYFYYLGAQMFLMMFYFILMLFSGDVCSTVVSLDLQRMGSSLVCGFTDAFAIFWMLIDLGVFLYLIYIVWSAAEHISMSFFPDLVAYKQRLHTQVGQPISQAASMKAPAHLQGDINRSRQQADVLSAHMSVDAQRLDAQVARS